MHRVVTVSNQIKDVKRPPNLEVEGDEELIRKIEDVLKDVYDPEIPVDVYNLGLIYKIMAKYENGRPKVAIVMTLTAVGCPVAGTIMAYINQAVIDSIPGIKEDDVEIELTFDPPWNPDMVSEEGRQLLKEIYGYDVVEEWKRNMQQAYQSQEYYSEEGYDSE